MRSFMICRLSSSNTIRVFKSRRMRWEWLVGHIGERSAETVLVGKNERRRLLGEPRRGWEDYIKMVFQEI
jgi:hypothetical protein